MRAIRRFSVVAAALSDRNGNAQFEINRSEASSSLLPIDPRNSEWFARDMNVARKVEVPTLTLPELISREGLPKVDLLKLDLQGAERLVLAGGVEVLDRVEVIYTEIFFEQLYEGAWLFWDMNEFLSHRGLNCVGYRTSSMPPMATWFRRTRPLENCEVNGAFSSRDSPHASHSEAATKNDGCKPPLLDSSIGNMRVLLGGFLSLLLIASGHAATLAGQQVPPGGKIEIRFPVSKYFQDIAAQGGNPRPDTGRAVVTFPPGFDPSRSWPILIVTSTSDFNRTSAMDADWYRQPATAEGWIVLGSDATIRPRIDSTQWRLGLLGGGAGSDPQRMAAIVQVARGLRRIFRRLETKRRPRADAGKERLCSRLRVFPERNQRRPPQRRLQDLPAWPRFSRGAGLAEQRRERYRGHAAAHNLVKASLERTGFKRVRLEQFGGGHQLKMSELRRALQWFRQLGGF